MIVECSSCRTRFRVDESRIPGRGARMRCRRCGEAIIVMKDESGRPAAPVDRRNLFDLRSVLRRPEDRPAAGPVAPPPGGAPTLSPPAGERPEADMRTAQPAQGEPRAGLRGDDEAAATGEALPDAARPDESGATYLRQTGPGHEEPSTGPREEETGSAPEEAPLDAARPDESGATYLRQTEPAHEEVRADPRTDWTAQAPEDTPDDAAPRDEAWAPDLRGPGPAHEEPSIGPSEEEAGSAPEEAPLDAARPDVRGQDLPLPDPADTTEEAFPAAEPSSPPAASPIFSLGQETPAGRDRTLELVLDDDGSLDFLKDEYEREFDISGSLRPQPTEEQETRPEQAAVEEAPVEEAMSERLQAIQRELEEIGGGAPDGGEEPPPPPEPAPPPRPAVPKPYPAIPRAGEVRAARPAIATLLVVFLLIAGGGAYLGFTRSGKETLRKLIPGMESLWLGGENAGPRYSVGNLIGYYEGNAKAGKLFVIKGVVTNQGRKKRSGIRIHAGLLGRNGRPVAEKAVFAGNILSGEALRTSSRQAIEKEMANRWGDSLVNLDIPPGKSVPFMVVFFDAPEGIEEYRLDARDVK